MKTIGLIGGMSWESTSVYYRLINERVRALRGGLHSAPLLLHSVDFATIAEQQSQQRWDLMSEQLCSAGQGLVSAGADFLLICTNTMHKVADEVEHASQRPLLHIVDVTAQAIRAQRLSSVALLGTRYTMEGELYPERFTRDYQIDVMTPDTIDQDTIHRIIYEELCQGVVRPESKRAYQQIIQKLQHQGAQGVVLGCTEIALLVQPEDCSIPVFDTTEIHAHAAVDYALGREE